MTEQQAQHKPVFPPKNGGATVKLKQYLEHGDDEITELALRMPSVEDLAEIGYPFAISPGDCDTRVEIKANIVLKYASRLSALPPSVIKTMSLGDFMAVQGVVMGFFGDLGAA